MKKDNNNKKNKNKNKYQSDTRIKLNDLGEGCVLVDSKGHVWVVEDIIVNRIILSNVWGDTHYTRAINIGRKGYLYGFSLFE